jgi:hypothetical protein
MLFAYHLKGPCTASEALRYAANLPQPRGVSPAPLGTLKYWHSRLKNQGLILAEGWEDPACALIPIGNRTRYDLEASFHWSASDQFALPGSKGLHLRNVSDQSITSVVASLDGAPVGVIELIPPKGSREVRVSGLESSVEPPAEFGNRSVIARLSEHARPDTPFDELPELVFRLHLEFNSDGRSVVDDWRMYYEHDVGWIRAEPARDGDLRGPQPIL